MMQNCLNGTPARRSQACVNFITEPAYSLLFALQELIVFREDGSLHPRVAGRELVVVVSSVVSALDLELVILLRLLVLSKRNVLELILW